MSDRLLNNRFPKLWIGNVGPVLWPPRTPDLTPLDFFFWGYVKNIIYSVKVRNLTNGNELSMQLPQSRRTCSVTPRYRLIIDLICAEQPAVLILKLQVPCNTYYMPENCDFEKLPILTVEDFERCGPAQLNISARNYFLGAAGRRITYNDNKEAYRRIKIVPKILRDVSRSNLEVSTLGQRLSLPIGLSPVAFQKLVHPLGEIVTARAIRDIGTVMILSSYSSSTIEEVAENAKGGSSHLWMQTYFFKNKTFTVDIVSRAEKAGFEAIVVTVDAPTAGGLTCNARLGIADDNMFGNFPGERYEENLVDVSQTFKDITWLRSVTKLPIIAKGILSAKDARRALSAGVKGILVSNHGGRQLDSAPATIEVLSNIVNEVNRIQPRIDVYIDGGIRNGWDVYKAIAMGAKMVFVGRPIIWGLAKAGEAGVREVLDILRREFEEAMTLSGATNPSKITKDTLITPASKC